jgi:transcriptional regulator with XRE-family HTH domain
MAQVKRSGRTTQISAATNERNFRTFLLMAQFEAAEIGARIRQARKERGLSQQQLAEIGPFSKRSLQDYETGKTIPYSHLRDLARLLHKPEEWFLYGVEPISQDEELLAQLRVLPDRIAALEAELRDLQALLDERLPPQAAGEEG